MTSFENLKNMAGVVIDESGVYTPQTTKNDDVLHPAHYCDGRKYEPIKVIQDWQLDFCLGNTVKYISRAGRKTSAAMSDYEKELQDLKKAKFYLDYKIAELEQKKRDESVNLYQE